MPASIRLASVEFAKELFGASVFGPEEVESVFGIKTPKNAVPPIPFTETDLIRAHGFDQILILHAHSLTMKRIHDMGKRIKNGTPLIAPDLNCGELEQPFFMDDPVRSGWWLTTKEPLLGSLGENYLEQTAAISGYLQLFVGDALTDSERDAITEFELGEKALARHMEADTEDLLYPMRLSARYLIELQLNRLFRETPTEVLYRLTLYEEVVGTRLLTEHRTWTNRRTSSGNIVHIGCNHYGTAFWSSEFPGWRGNIGACLTRSRSGNV